MATMIPMDALGLEALAEFNKDLKDNKNVNQELILLVQNQLGQGRRCHVDDFMQAIKCSETVIIGFFRKLMKLKPNKFIKTELLSIEPKRGKDAMRQALREFLLWNQGVPTVVPAIGGAVATASSASYKVHSDGRITTTVASGPLAIAQTSKSQSTSEVRPEPLPKDADVEDGAARRIPATAVAKIQPHELWKNSSLSTRHSLDLSSLSPRAASGLSSASGMIGFETAGYVSSMSKSRESLSLSPKPSEEARTAGSGAKAKANQEQNRKELETEVINLLLEDEAEEIDLYDSLEPFPLAFFEPSVPLNPVPAQVANQSKGPRVSPPSSSSASGGVPIPSYPGLPSHSLPANGAAAAAASVPQFAPASSTKAKQPKQPKKKARMSHEAAAAPAPVVGTVPAAHAAASTTKNDTWYQQQATLIHAYYRNVDLAYCVKTLKECSGNMTWAMQRVQQYAVDIEEARLMDQARLVSETTAQQDKIRASEERDKVLGTSKALTEFKDSEIMQRVAMVRTFLSRDESALTTDGVQLRKFLINFLDEEKKAIKWYQDSARAYVRQVAARVPPSGSPTAFFEQELAELKRVLYMTASESGAPLPFLAALDAETVGNTRPGQVLGFSVEAPVELA